MTSGDARRNAPVERQRTLRRVVVTGMGGVCPLGEDWKTVKLIVQHPEAPNDHVSAPARGMTDRGLGSSKPAPKPMQAEVQVQQQMQVKDPVPRPREMQNRQAPMQQLPYGKKPPSR